MPLEIERKFLVTGNGWRASASAVRRLRQGYLALTDRAVIRVRISDDGNAWVGIKENKIGRSHGEFEYAIPPEEAKELLDLCSGSIIDKNRFYVMEGHYRYEVDEFLGSNAGLIIAEIELTREDEEFPQPDWLGREVTADRRFYNAALSRKPWQQWGRG